MKNLNISYIVSRINNIACLAIFIGIFLPFIDAESRYTYSMSEIIWENIEYIFKGRSGFGAVWFILCIVAFFAALIAGNLFKQSLSMKNPIVMLVSGGYVRYMLSVFMKNGISKMSRAGYSSEYFESGLGTGYDLIVAGVTVIIICGIVGICVNYYIENIKYNENSQIPKFLNNVLGQAKGKLENINTNNKANNFCSTCGAKISENQQFCSQCGKDISTKITCSKCGAKNEKDSTFCSTCGTNLK